MASTTPSIAYPDAPSNTASMLDDQRRTRLRAIGPLRFDEGPPPDDDEFLRRVGDATAIILGWSIPNAVMERAPYLEFIAFAGIGAAKFVDLDCARAQGIVVSNTPGYADDTVAEHTMALMLDAARNVTRLDRRTRAGQWDDTHPGFDLRGRILGLVGFGGIGQRVAELARAFGMQVLVWTPNPEAHRPKAPPVRFVDLDALIEASDIVSLHLAHTPQTEGLLSAERIRRLRPGTVFINTARGELVDEAALIEALREGAVSAGIDVFHAEPLPPDHPLLALDNVVLTPHSAYNTPEAGAAILDISIDNIAAFYAGSPRNVVA